MPRYTDWDAIRKRMNEYALKAVQARVEGAGSIVLGVRHQQRLMLNVGGYCARFVRQIAETAADVMAFDDDGVFGWQADTARHMERALRKMGYYVGKTKADAAPGDIVGLNLPAGEDVGHIAICVEVDGQKMIAENTSSKKRGKPRRAGTKLSAFEDMVTEKGKSRISGIYRLRDLG